MSLIYSWILPIKNEASSLPQLFSEISGVMKKYVSGKNSWEVIAIDDASEDSSLTTLKSLTSQIPQLKIIRLPSHHGKWAALSAGFAKAKGKVIITLDADLQDNPKELPKLITKFEQGYDLVSGWRKARHDPFYKVAISLLGNWFASLLTHDSFKDLNSPFKVYRRNVIADLPTYGSLLRFTMLFSTRLGYKVIEVPVIHRPRRFGTSKFGIIKYVRILYDLLLVLLIFTGSGRLRKHT